MKTVHMIGNAHLDPVWLWPRSEGVDAVLATARSACDRLDEYPDFIFTCSTRWFHEKVELLDPGLFERICRFVQAGRWQLVGGMVVQPDCNLPSAEGFARQFEMGQRYYREKFGRPTTVGYNVDSFGHTAYLPRFLREAGLDSYVFMRPGSEDKKLPANIFRWRSPDGSEVTAFRLAEPYCADIPQISENIKKSLAELPDGLKHTMCFFGVGNHGGGPTKLQIEWILEHSEDIEGAKLIFSHPRAFFDDINSDIDKLPIISGELQHYAVGCYSVQRRIKVAMARAQGRLLQAQAVTEALSDYASENARERIEKAWDSVLFNQFHDILGGTSLDKASLTASGELLAAESQADEVITSVTRRAFRSEACPGEHRIVVFNPSDRCFDGFVEHGPWLQGGKAELSLFDDQGTVIQFQQVEALAMVSGLRRLLFKLSIAPRSWRILKLIESPPRDSCGQETKAMEQRANHGDMLETQPKQLINRYLKITPDVEAVCLNNWKLSLEVLDDPTDTWGHFGDRFEGVRKGAFVWSDKIEVVESGPIRKAIRLNGEFGNSRAWLRLMILGDEPVLRLRLLVVWAQVRQLLRLRLQTPDTICERTDLISGGFLDRPTDGAELPLNGGGIVVSNKSARTAIVAPEIFSGSVDSHNVNLTLLRSPYIAHHEPAPAGMCPDQPVADQGNHEFDLLIYPDCVDEMDQIEKLAREMMMPPVTWDLTG